MKFEVLDFPWSHGYSESFVDDEFAKKMNKEFPKNNVCKTHPDASTNAMPGLENARTRMCCDMCCGEESEEEKV